MSHNATGHAFRQRLPGPEKWLLVCLADRADDWGDSIFLSLDTLEEKTGFSRSTLKRLFRKLILTHKAVVCVARATPVSPPFYRIVGVPEPIESKGPMSCPPVLRKAVLYAFSQTCEYCKQPGTKDLGPDGKAWNIERVLPASRGGVYTPDNVTLSCRHCNLRKKANPAPAGTRTLTDMLNLERVRSEPPPKKGTGPAGPRDLAPPEVQPEPREGADLDPDPSLDPSLDLKKQGAAHPTAPRKHKTNETPDDNLGVITKLAHEVFDVCGEGVELGEAAEALKSRCAHPRMRIAYNATVIRKALDSALWQRRNRRRPA